MKALVSAGQAHGVPISAVLAPTQILASEHFQAVGAIADAEIVPRVRSRVPTGYFVVDGQHVGFPSQSPPAGHDEARWLAEHAAMPGARQDPAGVRLTGCGVVDLGVIVAGGELSRLFGDLGAEVIKVESADYPGRIAAGPRRRRHERVVRLDASQQPGARPGSAQRRGQANLRPTGCRRRRGIRQLQARNAYRPGVSYDTLRALNPRIVLAESSAFGDTGPWSNRMGYGPLVRATAGVSRLWTSDEHAPTRPTLAAPFLRRDDDLSRSRGRPDHRDRARWPR